jgi:hypothetical protein
LVGLTSPPKTSLASGTHAHIDTGCPMNVEDVTLVYQFFENDWELHHEIVSFSNEEAAIEFGINNLKENRHKREKLLYDLEITIMYDDVASFEEHSVEFWGKFDDNYKRIVNEISERYLQLYKKVK